MFSLITCSNNPARLAALRAMYDKAFGSADWEFIAITDAKSLASGYNRGAAQARGDILLFSHDDMEILSPDFPKRVEQHLQRFDLFGVAGTSKVVAPAWFLAGHPYLFGQCAHPSATGIGWGIAIYNVPKRAVGNIQALDGVILATRRSLWEKVKFDEVVFDGWHHYDVDFSYASYKAGFNVGVVCDIAVLHQSSGQFKDAWKASSLKFIQKWLPGYPQTYYQNFVWTSVTVPTRADCLRIMTPEYWDDP